VKRFLAVPAVLLVLSFAAYAPPVGATGGAACVIGGTMQFTPDRATPARGLWRIEPGVINCQGFFRAKHFIIGPGRFTGFGTFTEVPEGTGHCRHIIGTGQVDYVIPTDHSTQHISEQQDFVFAGAGVFATPSLRGSFLATSPSQGDCMTEPVARASFVAQAVMLRFDGIDF
jgi:hypothetical protein